MYRIGKNKCFTERKEKSEERIRQTKDDIKSNDS